MKRRNLILDFSYSYPTKLENSKEFTWIECSDIEECSMFCEKSAEEEIRKRIRPYGPSGIHFIDSGDYHYVTKFFVDFIKEPFSLVLIDHHTDMQKPMMEGMLSCGNWARKLLEENEFLQQLVLIGPEREACVHLDMKNKEKILCILYEDLEADDGRSEIIEIRNDIPIYLSIDKDVLRKTAAKTNWNQGFMTLGMLEYLIGFLFLKREVIGMDICGEYKKSGLFPEYAEALRLNTNTNEEIYEYVMDLLRVHHADRLG